jgi:hypothetical protein
VVEYLIAFRYSMTVCWVWQVREKVFAAVNGGLPSDQQATPEVVAEHVAKPKPAKPKPPPSE